MSNHDRPPIYSATIKGHYAEITRKVDLYTSEIVCTILTDFSKGDNRRPHIGPTPCAMSWRASARPKTSQAVDMCPRLGASPPLDLSQRFGLGCLSCPA